MVKKCCVTGRKSNYDSEKESTFFGDFARENFGTNGVKWQKRKRAKAQQENLCQIFHFVRCAKLNLRQL